jgi:hypothetical protein
VQFILRKSRAKEATSSICNIIIIIIIIIHYVIGAVLETSCVFKETIFSMLLNEWQVRNDLHKFGLGD